jgi:hypothetical protein
MAVAVRGDGIGGSQSACISWHDPDVAVLLVTINKAAYKGRGYQLSPTAVGGGCSQSPYITLLLLVFLPLLKVITKGSKTLRYSWWKCGLSLLPVISQSQARKGCVGIEDGGLRKLEGTVPLKPVIGFKARNGE